MRERPVGLLYRCGRRLNMVNHREARKTASGTVWHGPCISFRVHASTQGRAGAFFRSRRPPFLFWKSGRDLLVPEELLELAGLVHLHHDVGAADELALDVELGNGRPVRIGLDTLPDLRVLEDVDRLERHVQMVEDGDRARREAALGEE